MPPQKAELKLFISNPFTIEAVSHNIKAFITRVNKPRVKILIGKVRSRIRGRIKAFIKPNTKTVIKSAQPDAIVMPGTILETSRSANAFKSQRNKIGILFPPHIKQNQQKWSRDYYQGSITQEDSCCPGSIHIIFLYFRWKKI